MPEQSGRYYDRQEVRDHAEREMALFHALPGLIRHAIDNAPFFKSSLAHIDPDKVTSREALASLPVLRKEELIESQRASLPFGGLTATATKRLGHIFWSPGPIFDPEGLRADYWRFARAMFAAGIRSGDLVHNTFSYHMTPAGMMIDMAARALGCPVFPAGGGQSDRQAEIIHDLKPKAYAGTPSFLMILMERARTLGYDAGSISKALVSGEAFLPPQRDRLRDEFEIDAYQCYGTADLGLVAYETEAREGLVVDESLILEIVRPGSGTPVPVGEVGEVVVTLFNPDYPLIRFATGDLSKLLPGESPCGRTNMRIAGWMGRADQRTKIRGMFVDPRQLSDLAGRFDEVGKVRLVVDHQNGKDRLVLSLESEVSDASLHQRIEESTRMITGLRCEIRLVESGSLPNDGKVIDDLRPTG